MASKESVVQREAGGGDHAVSVDHGSKFGFYSKSMGTHERFLSRGMIKKKTN